MSRIKEEEAIDFMLEKKAKTQGFTLIEVMLAVFIIAVGVIPVIGLFSSGSRSVEKGGVILEASIAAQNIVDKAKNDSFLWKKIPIMIQVPSKQYPIFKLPKFFSKKYKASGTLSIEVAPNHTILGTGAKEKNLIQITFILNWIENGMPKKYRVLTYRANTNSINLKTSAKL